MAAYFLQGLCKGLVVREALPPLAPNCSWSAVCAWPDLALSAFIWRQTEIAWHHMAFKPLSVSGSFLLHKETQTDSISTHPSLCQYLLLDGPLGQVCVTDWGEGKRWGLDGNWYRTSRAGWIFCSCHYFKHSVLSSNLSVKHMGLQQTRVGVG